MTHAFQVLGQIRARAVLGRAGQILHILLLGYHRPNMLVFALKRKSCHLKDLATKQDLRELELRLKHDLTLRLGGMLVVGITLVATLVKIL